MPGIERTPVDEVSGLPLLIVPQDESLPYLWGESLNRGPDGNIMADWNHAYHPSRQVPPILRSTRVQHVLRETHDAYHHYYEGPPSIQTKADEFRAVVLTAAGYIPPEGLMFTSVGPRQIGLSTEQRGRLQTSGEVRLASFSSVQAYMRGVVLSQPADHIRRSTIDRFLSLDSLVPDEARERQRLAHLLVALFIDRIEEPLDMPYRLGREQQLLDPALPTRPGDFIHRTILFTTSQRRKTTRELIKKLSTERDGLPARQVGSLALA